MQFYALESRVRVYYTRRYTQTDAHVTCKYKYLVRPTDEFVGKAYYERERFSRKPYISVRVCAINDDARYSFRNSSRIRRGSRAFVFTMKGLTISRRMHNVSFVMSVEIYAYVFLFYILNCIETLCSCR